MIAMLILDGCSWIWLNKLLLCFRGNDSRVEAYVRCHEASSPWCDVMPDPGAL
jgi:hypothetical protein